MKFVFAAVLGASLVGVAAGFWAYAQSKADDRFGFGYNYGYWVGSGGWIALVIGALVAMYYARSKEVDSQVGSSKLNPLNEAIKGFKDGMTESKVESYDIDKRVETQVLSNVRSKYGPVVAVFMYSGII